MADKMVRCQEGHFFDPTKHNACPWCALPADGGGGPEKTRPVRPGAISDAAPPPLPMPGGPMSPGMQGGMASPMASPMSPGMQGGMASPMPGVMSPGMQASTPAAASTPVGPKPGVTRRIGQEETGRADPVVGWLVCLEGPDRGRDFRLHGEKNFIGRSPAMDVCILSDDTVSREKHGVVIFDPKKQVFWALPGDSSGLVYLNGDIVHTPTQIHAHDTIEIGQTKLVLIPFCGDKYTWNPPAPAPSSTSIS